MSLSQISPITIQFPDAALEQARKIAYYEGRSVGFVIRDFFDKYFPKFVKANPEYEAIIQRDLPPDAIQKRRKRKKNGKKKAVRRRSYKRG